MDIYKMFLFFSFIFFILLFFLPFTFLLFNLLLGTEREHLILLSYLNIENETKKDNEIEKVKIDIVKENSKKHKGKGI